MQQINKKKQEGPLKPKSVFTHWNIVSLQEIKTLFSIIIQISVLASHLHGITGVCIRLFIPNKQLLLKRLRIGSLRY